MTPAEWKRVEESLAHPHGSVKLLCDGIEVCGQVQMVKPLRYAVVVFVGGVWKGEWLRADPPRDEHRFLNPHEQSFYKAAELKRMKGLFSAKQLREMLAKKSRWFSPDFPTAKAFRRRISSQCKAIELVTCTEDEVAKLTAKIDQTAAAALLGKDRHAELAKEAP